MKGIIILDGPDCAGKTTLQQALIRMGVARDITIVGQHNGKPDAGKAWDMHSRSLMDGILLSQRDECVVVIDRHFMSEAIYGKVYREGSEYSHAMRYMDMLLTRVRALRVICCPPTHVVKDTHAKMKEIRHEEYTDDMDRVAKLYLSMWQSPVNESSLPGRDYVEQITMLGGVHNRLGWYHYDYTKQTNVEDYANELLDELVHESFVNEDALDMPIFMPFTGQPGKNSALLVGDELSAANDLLLPFWCNNGSSGYLATMLHKLHVDVSRLAICNVNDPHGVDVTRYLSNRCGRVIAMGRKAERTMLLQGIEHDAVIRHPQHARRFNYHDDSYVKEMSLALNGWANARRVA